MKHVAMLFASILLMALVGCNAKKEKPQPLAEAHEEIVDTTVYGVCGDGTSMHSLQLVTDAGDTLTYTILDAEADLDGEVSGGIVSNVEGGLMSGDKVAVTGMKIDGELIANRVINEIEEGGTVRSNVKAETNPWTSWKILNGQLLLNRDTFDITSLGADSLYIENQKGIYIFKRQK